MTAGRNGRILREEKTGEGRFLRRTRKEEPMIFYFSGTGNSRWAAQQLAKRLGDTARDILEPGGRPAALEAEERVGLVFPVYAWGVPGPVLSFARSLPKTDAFRFGVCTCGSEAGHTMKKLAELLPLQSSYSLVMPNNYILASDVESRAVIQRKIAAAEAAIERMAGEIREKKPVYRVTEGTFAALKSGLVHEGFKRFASGTMRFYASDACNGCGLCARECPSKAISMAEGKPFWVKKSCCQCLRCINACPRRAIQCGKGTQKRGRYTFETMANK